MGSLTEIRNYCEYLSRIHKDRAAVAYASSLRAFGLWLREQQKKSLLDARVGDVELYISTITNRNTANSHLAAIRGFYKYHANSLDLDSPDVMREMQRSNQLSLIQLPRQRVDLKRSALTADEVKSLLKFMQKKYDDLIYSGMVLELYFGARPVELVTYINQAEIDFDKKDMFLLTAKTNRIRYLTWHDKITPYLETWVDGRDRRSYTDWLRKSFKAMYGDYVTKSGVSVTPKVGRKTVETQLRLVGVDDLYIRAILGHTHQSISDVYTDYLMIAPTIRDILETKHYMITERVI